VRAVRLECKERAGKHGIVPAVLDEERVGEEAEARVVVGERISLACGGDDELDAVVGWSGEVCLLKNCQLSYARRCLL
jgi:hypothetical protein